MNQFKNWTPLPPGALRVLDALVRLGPASAAELAEALRIGPVSVRQHLRALAERGFAKVAQVRTGRPGPPARVWQITAKGQGQVRPSRYPSLIEALLRAAKARLGSEEMVGLLEETAHCLLEESMPERLAPFTEKVAFLQRLFDELAVGTKLERKGRGYELVLMSPLFPEVLYLLPEAYSFYRTLAEEALGVEVELEVKKDVPLASCVLRFREA